MATSKRMIPNVDSLEGLLKEVHYNKDTNTLEIGGNVYIDGEERLKHIMDGDGKNFYYKEFYYPTFDLNTIIFMWDAQNNTYFGIGTLDTSQEGYIYLTGIAITSDEMAMIIPTVDLGLVDVEQYLYQIAEVNNTQRKLFEHQLTLSTAATSFYITYYSTNNLVIDSLQDLTSVVKPNANTKLGLGSTYAKYEGGVWKTASGDAITSVSDNVVVVD